MHAFNSSTERSAKFTRGSLGLWHPAWTPGTWAPTVEKHKAEEPWPGVLTITCYGHTLWLSLNKGRGCCGPRSHLSRQLMPRRTPVDGSMTWRTQSLNEPGVARVGIWEERSGQRLSPLHWREHNQPPKKGDVAPASQAS